MSALAALALCLAVARAPRGGDEPAFVELASSRAAYFEHEPIRLTLRVGFERGFRARLVPLFARALDLPVQLEAPFLAGFPGVLAQPDEGPAGPGARVTLAVGEDVVSAALIGDVLRDGRTFEVIELERVFLPERAGELVFPAPRLRYAYATRFGQDLFAEARPLDRELGEAVGAALALRVEPLPEPGRPAGFIDAVGSFTVAAATSAEELEVGKSFALVLTVTGTGNLTTFTAPRLELEGFHVYGLLEGPERSPRTLTYDLAPLSAELAGVPEIPFSFFDPERGAYETVRTAAIPLRVRAGAGPTRAEPEVERDEGEGGGGARWMGGVALGVALLGGVIWLRALRRRASAVPELDPAVVRANAAAARFEEALARPAHDAAAALSEYLSARLACPTAAIIAPDLDRRLRKVGVPSELAARTAHTLDELVAARYGSGTGVPSAEELVGLVREMESVFAR